MRQHHCELNGTKTNNKKIDMPTSSMSRIRFFKSLYLRLMAGSERNSVSYACKTTSLWEEVIDAYLQW
jgi:hypothetical protein